MILLIPASIDDDEGVGNDDDLETFVLKIKEMDKSAAYICRHMASLLQTVG